MLVVLMLLIGLLVMLVVKLVGLGVVAGHLVM